jgi:hypothetical protein
VQRGQSLNLKSVHVHSQLRYEMDRSTELVQKQNLNIYVVDEDKVRKFYDSFETTAQRVDKDIEIIREWLKVQPHLPEVMGKSIFL